MVCNTVITSSNLVRASFKHTAQNGETCSAHLFYTFFPAAAMLLSDAPAAAGSVSAVLPYGGKIAAALFSCILIKYIDILRNLWYNNVQTPAARLRIAAPALVRTR